MFVEKYDNSKLAIIYTHYIYRNTIIEKYHTQNMTMDESLYKRIHKVVAQKPTYLSKFIVFDKEIVTSEDIARTCMSLDSTTGKEFLRFLSELKEPFGNDWDNPIEYKDEQIKNKADYILGGNFIESCKKHVTFNDYAMRYINKDICNGVYTLIQRNQLC